MRSSSDIKASLAVWYPARDALAQGQSYSFGGINVTRADLNAVNTTIQQLEKDLALSLAADRGDAAGAAGFGLTQLLRGP